ncbi:multidrug effflux MFS transporter [Streptomyces sp. NPDC058464]|uniref:multidrug effflux MFS transporter n=1 Tax=Streptomyces sp. NPDC058464 TaxID=3346511 RepID=UPI003653A802
MTPGRPVPSPPATPTEAATVPRLPWRRLAVLGGLSTFGPLSTDLYLSALPDLTRRLHAGDSLGQATLSLCVIGLAVGQLVTGPLSDRFGRRRPMLVGVGAFALLSAGCALAPSIEVLLVLRFAQGLAGGAGLVIARAMVRDLYQGREAARVFSLIMLFAGAAPVCGPLAGGLVLRFTDWRGTFVVLAAVGLVLLLAATTLPETHGRATSTDGGSTRRELLRLLSQRRFRTYAGLLGTTSVVLFTYISMSSYVLQDGEGLTSGQYSLVFALNAAGLVGAGQLNRRLLLRVSPERLAAAATTASLATATLLVVSLAFGPPLWLLLPGLFVLVASVGCTTPNATALALDDAGRVAGTAAALLGCVQYLLGALVPPLVSGDHATATALVGTVCVAATASAVLARYGTRPARTA